MAENNFEAFRKKYDSLGANLSASSTNEGTISPDFAEFKKKYDSVGSQQPVKEGSYLGDLGRSVKTGAMGLGKDSLAILSSMTGGNSEFLKGAVKQTAAAEDILNREYLSQRTPETVAAEKAVSDAKGFFPTIGAGLTHPRAIGTAIARSLPASVAPAIGLRAAGVKSAGLLFGAEGAISGGDIAAQGITQDKDFKDYAPQALATAAAVAGTSAIGGKLGVDAGLNFLRGNKAGNIFKAIVGEAAQEGVQSPIEQMASNSVAGNDLMQGVPEAAGMGVVTGGAMAGGMHLASLSKPSVNPATGQPTGKSEVVNSDTGSTIENKDILKAYTHMNDVFASSQDTSSEAYKQAYKDSVEILDRVMTPKTENGTVDPIDAKNARFIKDTILSAHESKLREEKKDSSPATTPKEETKTTASSEEVKAPTPESPVNSLSVPEEAKPTPQEVISSAPTEVLEKANSESLSSIDTSEVTELAPSEKGNKRLISDELIRRQAQQEELDSIKRTPTYGGILVNDDGSHTVIQGPKVTSAPEVTQASSPKSLEKSLISDELIRRQDQQKELDAVKRTPVYGGTLVNDDGSFTEIKGPEVTPTPVAPLPTQTPISPVPPPAPTPVEELNTKYDSLTFELAQPDSNVKEVVTKRNKVAKELSKEIVKKESIKSVEIPVDESSNAPKELEEVTKKVKSITNKTRTKTQTTTEVKSTDPQSTTEVKSTDPQPTPKKRGRPKKVLDSVVNDKVPVVEASTKEESPSEERDTQSVFKHEPVVTPTSSPTIVNPIKPKGSNVVKKAIKSIVRDKSTTSNSKGLSEAGVKVNAIYDRVIEDSDIRSSVMAKTVADIDNGSSLQDLGLSVTKEGSFTVVKRNGIDILHTRNEVTPENLKQEMIASTQQLSQRPESTGNAMLDVAALAHSASPEYMNNVLGREYLYDPSKDPVNKSTEELKSRIDTQEYLAKVTPIEQGGLTVRGKIELELYKAELAKREGSIVSDIPAKTDVSSIEKLPSMEDLYAKGKLLTKAKSARGSLKAPSDDIKDLVDMSNEEFNKLFEDTKKAIAASRKPIKRASDEIPTVETLLGVVYGNPPSESSSSKGKISLYHRNSYNKPNASKIRLGTSAKGSTTNHEAMKATLEKLVMGLGKPFFKNNPNVSIEYVINPLTYDFPADFVTDPDFADNINSIPGFIYSGSEGTRIFLIGDNNTSTQELKETFVHELVGHFGVAQILGGKEKYEKFLMTLLKNSPKLRDDAFAMINRWGVYTSQWIKKNVPEGVDPLDVLRALPESERFKVPDLSGRAGYSSIIPNSVAIKIMDEYMAELTREVFEEEAFVREAVGFGYKSGEKRSSIKSVRQAALKKFLANLSHNMRKDYGTSFQDPTYTKLKLLVAESISNNFETLDPDILKASDKFGISYQAPKLDTEYFTSQVMNVDEIERASELNGAPLLSEEEFNSLMFGGVTTTGETISLSVAPRSPDVVPFSERVIRDNTSFYKAFTSGFGKIGVKVTTDVNGKIVSSRDTRYIGAKAWEKFQDKISSHPLTAAWSTFKNMPAKEVYKAMELMYRGRVASSEKYVKSVSAIISSISPVQNQLVFEYMTTPNSNPDVLLKSLTKLQRDTISKAKESIREMGKAMVAINPSLQESFDKNDDAYLHTVYTKYLSQYKGSNKRPFLGELKKKKDLTSEERMALGQIRDVRFLIPETLGILARDQTILEMFNTIRNMSHENSIGWVLDSTRDITYLGKKLNYDDALQQVRMNEFYISEAEKGSATFQPESKAHLDSFKASNDQLKADISALDNEFTLNLEAAYQNDKARGDTKAKDRNEYLSEKYERLPNNAHNGVLRNKYVRREIAKDLHEFNSVYALDNKDGLAKFIGEGGTLERLNAFWKLGKVGLNPASVIRNVFGNFTLLDLSTPTNKASLAKSLYKEMASLGKNTPSETWKLAEEYGLHTTGFSAVELQVLHANFAKEYTQLQKDLSKKNYLGDHLHVTDPHLHSITRAVGATADYLGDKGSKVFQYMEGVFKTVAFGDYISRWESENKIKKEDLTDEQRDSLFAHAANHANDSLMDYTKVPSWLRTLRRTPLGDPFITFTYKAFPLTVKSMVNNPIKFAQYAALPSLISMMAMAMNDWDDKDYNDAMKKLPEFYRESTGVALLPIKDDQGRMQWVNLDPMLPWSQWVGAIRNVHGQTMDQGPWAVPSASLDALHRQLGFLGGPVPQMIVSYLSGTNSFTGQPIATPGASPEHKMWEFVKYSWDLATPGFINSNGWANNMYELFSGNQDKDKFGVIKNTASQVALDITGFKPVPSREGGEQQIIGKYNKLINDQKTYIHKVASDQSMNPLDRASEIKDTVERIKHLRMRLADEMK